MTTRVYVDRSRYESAQRCLRARFYGYHQNGMGIQSSRMPLPLAVGSSVHKGLASLLESAQHTYYLHGVGGVLNQLGQAELEIHEEAAIAVALADFAQYQHALDAPDAEQASFASLGPTQGSVPGLDSVSEMGFAIANERRNEFDEYLFREQSALVEALVRAYARRRLRPLLEQFEVLEVEREGEWELSRFNVHPEGIKDDPFRILMFMSRPDALLRDRESNQLYLLSYKTTGAWDLRKARDAEHDMQGMSEGIEIERRLAEWWERIHNRPRLELEGGAEGIDFTDLPERDREGCYGAMFRYLSALDAPPRILAVRYEYLLKGERWKDKELSARFGVEMRSQKSHLIRAYEAVSVPMRGSAGYNIGDVAWSWDYIREDGKTGSLAWQNWKSRPVWEVVYSVKQWINALDDAAETMSGEDTTMGMPPRLLGYKCDAQAVGLTVQHPLDVVFVPPITCYRNSDDLRDMVDQMESQERRIAEGVAAVNSATDEGERRHLLNIHFPQTRRACEYPTTCSYSRVCYGSDDVKRDPLASGLYKIRKANHPQEQGGNGNG